MIFSVNFKIVNIEPRLVTGMEAVSLVRQAFPDVPASWIRPTVTPLSQEFIFQEWHIKNIDAFNDLFWKTPRLEVQVTPTNGAYELLWVNNQPSFQNVTIEPYLTLDTDLLLALWRDNKYALEFGVTVMDIHDKADMPSY